MATGNRTDRDNSHESPSAEAARQNPDGPMTENQAGHLRVLSEEAGEEYQEGDRMTAAEADQRIRQLQERAGYGDNPAKPDGMVRKDEQGGGGRQS